MNSTIKIKEIFSGLDLPSITYVAQDNGRHESNLILGVEEGGNLCLITGSSKTGKTTLYRKVLNKIGREPLVIRCDSTLTAEEFWKKPLEKINFERLTSISSCDSNEKSSSGKIGGKIGWKWLANLIGEVNLGVKKSNSETETREKIISQPSPSHLVPLLKFSNAILVVEDFHYLNEDVQKQVFQQWKTFTDDQVSIIVVGTTHHGVDLAHANSDLVGRIQQIDLGRWEASDLRKIASKGFCTLKVEVPYETLDIISKESSGLPIIVQQVCGQLFYDRRITEFKVGSEISFTKQDAFNSLHNTALRKYKQFDSWYLRLKDGPRKKNRKYNTYEIVLLTFSIDPLKFELKRYEIDERIKKLHIEKCKIPPAASINTTLSALARFQEKNGFELLEWSKRDKTIYVLEPAFLFFIRWRKPRTQLPNLLDVFEDLLSEFRSTVQSLNKIKRFESNNSCNK